MNIPQVARMTLQITVTATKADGTALVIPGVDLALLPSRTTPTSSTMWTPMSWSDPVASILVAGPQADPTGAFVLSDGDLWVRVSQSPELLVSHVDNVKTV